MFCSLILLISALLITVPEACADYVVNLTVLDELETRGDTDILPVVAEPSLAPVAVKPIRKQPLKTVVKKKDTRPSITFKSVKNSKPNKKNVITPAKSAEKSSLKPKIIQKPEIKNPVTTPKPVPALKPVTAKVEEPLPVSEPKPIATPEPQPKKDSSFPAVLPVSEPQESKPSPAPNKLHENPLPKKVEIEKPSPEDVSDDNSIKLVFADNSDVLDSEVIRKLNKFSERATKLNPFKILIEAYHYDGGEKSFARKRLSLNRAVSVRSYLLGKGHKSFSIKIIDTDNISLRNDTIVSY